MHTPRLLIALAVVAVTASACHFADLDALEQKMLRECFTSPLAPNCAIADGNDAQQRLVFERFAQRNVTRAETQACILDVDCSEDRRRDDATAMVDDLQTCIADDPGARANDRARETRDAACVDECDLSLLDCGNDDDDCDVLTVSACFSAHDACIDAC